MANLERIGAALEKVALNKSLAPVKPVKPVTPKDTLKVSKPVKPLDPMKTPGVGIYKNG